MPWSVKKGGGSCDASQYAVIKDDDGSTSGCHDTKAAAEKQVAALYANESESKSMRRLDAPREDLIRMTTEVRQKDDGRTLYGYAAVFNRFTEINSWEGRFKEQIQPGAFKRTLGRGGQRNQIKVLFNHGMDPSIGDKPLGKPRTMKEDNNGLYVEVPLDDTSYNRDIIASLQSGALDGMSFRMSVIRDEWDKLDTDLPERTIQEIRLYEFGPVTFPAYAATEAGVRAHAPQAYAAFRAQQRNEVLVKAGFTPDAVVPAMERDDMSLLGDRSRYADTVYTPSRWQGFSVVDSSAVSSGTVDGLTLYVRSEDVSDESTDPPADETPEPTPDETNDGDGTTDVEPDTIEPPDDSVESDPSPDEPDAPVESDPATDADDPSDSAPSSSEEDVPRMSAVRKSIFVDHKLGEIFEREMARTERYGHLK